MARRERISKSVSKTIFQKNAKTINKMNVRQKPQAHGYMM